MTAASPTSSEWMVEPELLITGEAVALEIALATVANRITSGLIDYAVYILGTGLSVVVVMILTISTGSELRGNLTSTRTMLSLAFLVWMVVIPLLVELLSGGRSLGRIVTGTRAVRDDSGTVRLRHCLACMLLAVVEIWGTWTAPVLCANIVFKQGKRFGDVLAGTYVAREYHRSHMTSSLLVPPELAQQVTGTDLRALPGNLSLTARTFLQRTSSLVSSSCHQLGFGLASWVRGYVSPSLPVDTHPEQFPAAVLTKRHNRGLVLESRGRRLEKDVLRDMARPPYGMGGETRRH